MAGRKVTLEVTGSPKELVDVCKSFALDGIEFSFNPWVITAKLPSFAQANSLASKILAHTSLNAIIK